MKIKIFIADDHQLFLDGLRAILSSDPDIEIVGQGLNGKEVLEKLAVLDVDIILLDIEMPNTDVEKLTKAIKKEHPHVRVVILTMYHGTRYYTKLLKHGIHGYLYKSEGKEEFLTAIRKAHNDEIYISRHLHSRPAPKPKKDLNPTYDINKEPVEKILTRREIEVLKLIVQEHSNQAIADQLFISLGTVDTHRKNIILKLGVKNTVGLIKYCLQQGILNE